MLNFDGLEQFKPRENKHKEIGFDYIGLENKYNYLISYNKLSFSKGEYCFNNPKISISDLLAYFNRINELTKFSTFDLYNRNVDSKKFKWIEKPNQKIIDQIELITGESIDPTQPPCTLEIRLYTNQQDFADKSKNIKSPRVFGVVLEGSILYILFIDLFHEMYPHKKN
jgi:hypothetical protein